MYQVIDWEQDEAGKWRYRVNIGGKTVMFKWDTQVTDAVVQSEAQRYTAVMEQNDVTSNTE
jgi:hypothetical protein